MIRFVRNTIGAALAALLFILAVPLPSAADLLFTMDKLTIETSAGPVELNVEVADTDPKRAQGLMFRKQLPPNQGMIFLFDREEELTMWMKNTYISLDMVFIGPDWRITKIAAKTEPLSLDIISSGKPAARVLELAGGRAAALGLKVGDRVRFRAQS